MKLRDLEKNPLPNQWASDRKRVAGQFAEAIEGDIVLVCIGEQDLRWCLLNSMLDHKPRQFLATVTRQKDSFWCKKDAALYFRKNVVKVTLANVVEVRHTKKRDDSSSQSIHTNGNASGASCLACGSKERVAGPYPLCKQCYSSKVVTSWDLAKSSPREDKLRLKRGHIADAKTLASGGNIRMMGTGDIQQAFNDYKNRQLGGMIPRPPSQR